MSVLIRIPAALRSAVGGRRQVEFAVDRLEALLEEMDAAYPGSTQLLRDVDGNLRHSLNIYVNGQNIRYLQGLDTELRDGDEVSIVPALAGGMTSRLR